MPIWTNDQALAINERGGKIIVSAAAGSGKTAVLSQRVINFVLNGGMIDRLLIVTFTKAAATEMKERIKAKVKDAYEKDKKNNHLKDQLQLVDSAMITTMDSFYGSIVKDNFEKLGIDKNFNVLSNEEEKILKKRVIDDVLEDSFDNVCGFKEMLDFFGGYGLDKVKNIIFKIHSFLDTLPFKEDFISKSIGNYSVNNSYYKDIFLKQIHDKMNPFIIVYDEIINEMENENDFNKLIEMVKKEKNYLNSFINIHNFNDLSSLLRRISFDTLRTPKGHKDDEVMVKYRVIRDEIKKEIQKNLHELSFITDEAYEEEKMLAKKIMITLFNVIDEFDKRLFKEKKKINSYTFGDVAHFVIDLLIKDKKKTIIAKELSNRFDEILIDEYQDTNNLQNVIFNAISKNNENLFIVGDVKQSIYRFRSACPEIFNNDKKEACFDSFPKLITLSKNFRSRKEVLDFCNFIFENTMTDYFGEVNYDENEKLYLGASFEKLDNLDTEVCIIDDGLKEETDEDDLTKIEKEAIYVADKIKELLDGKHEVYDNKKGIKRNIKPSDIVILLRSLKDASYYAYALNKRNISSYLESSLEYFDNYEIKLIINMLKVIDNPYDDVSLMSVLNAPIINVSLDDVAKLRAKDKKISLYESLISDNSKINDALIKIRELRKYCYNHKLYELLNEIYKTFNFIPIISAMNNGKARQKNLIQMLNHASSFDDKKLSLHEFINYLEDIILSKQSLAGVNPLSNGDNVLITTIHKSKGLEYPVVILSETGKNFNFQDLRSEIMVNDDLGVSFNLHDANYNLKYESIWQMAFKEFEKSKMLSEELRILYVALTRAKEKIIITGFVNNLERLVTNASSKIGDEKVISTLYLKSVKNYMDIILGCLLRHNACKNIRDLSLVLPKTFVTESRISSTIINANEINESEFNVKDRVNKKEFDENWYNKIKDFKYNSKERIPKYLSVSEIKKDKNTKYVRVPCFMNDGVSHTSLGTLYHKIFEKLPIKKYSISSLNEEIDNLVLEKIITSEEKELVNLEKIFSYLTSSIYEDLLSSDKVYREKEFTFEVPSYYYDKSLKSGKILTSGIADLIFVNDDVYTIVDYKTDNVNNLLELKDRYKVQLDLYEIALMNIMKANKIRKFIYSIKFNEFIEV